MTGPAPLFSEPLEGEVLPPLGADVLELSCEVCGEVITGPAGGKGSAPMLLGKHRWSVHRIRKDGTQAPTKGRGGAKVDTATLIDGAHPLADTVAAVGAQVTGTGAPRAEQLARALGVGLSALTGGAARWAIRTDEVFQAAVAEHPDEGAIRQREAIAGLSLSPDAGTKVLAPVARILAPTALNRKYGRAVVENTDIGPAVTELADVVGVWFQYLAVRREQARELRAMRQQQAAGLGLVPPPPAAPPLPDFPPADGPIPGSGFIATAAH